MSPAQPFAGRINALDLGIRRLELLLSAGDSGTFICKGRQEEESRTELHVLGDRAYCKALGRSMPSCAGDLTLTHAPGRERGLGWGVLRGAAVWLTLCPRTLTLASTTPTPLPTIPQGRRIPTF